MKIFILDHLRAPNVAVRFFMVFNIYWIIRCSRISLAFTFCFWLHNFKGNEDETPAHLDKNLVITDQLGLHKSLP